MSRPESPVQHHGIQFEWGAFTHFGCGDAACFPVDNWRILYAQMKAQYIRYILTDFHVNRFSSVFENQLQKLFDGFWILATLFAAFRNCRSVRSNFTAQATLVFPTQRWPSKSRNKPRKTGKIPYVSWKIKMWWPKKSKISFHRVCERVTKSEPLTILSPLVRILVISTRTAASGSTKIVLEDFIQISYEGLAFT